MTSPRDDDDDREKPSWREIDKLRDGSRHARQEPKSREPKRKQEKKRQEALRQAEALFSGKRGLPEYRAALQALENVHGTAKFTAAARKFLAEYGLPEEWGVLIMLLDFPEVEVVQEILARLAALAPGRSRVEQQGLKGKLRVISLSAGSPEVKKTAQELLGRI